MNLRYFRQRRQLPAQRERDTMPQIQIPILIPEPGPGLDCRLFVNGSSRCSSSVALIEAVGILMLSLWARLACIWVANRRNYTEKPSIIIERQHISKLTLSYPHGFGNIGNLLQANFIDASHNLMVQLAQVFFFFFGHRIHCSSFHKGFRSFGCIVIF